MSEVSNGVLAQQLMNLTEVVKSLTKEISPAFYTVPEFAQALGVNRKTIENHCTQGLIAHTQIKAGGTRIILRSEKDRLIKEAIDSQYRSPSNTRFNNAVLSHIAKQLGV